ncbi:NFACT RNA binding domain-containing protein [Bacillus carboniphilus]|uniref:Rqc2 homolog RqcH n=1 Tax=Bacillus carboniphilus TaxID=86663 RepID=A0ABY9JW28_9BACI|nr:NFACT RNA binding domain-containing protein [Bacillus carboniphilus]WLR43585.1 NFACT RNA binding domain-containing protein [Bacillus carboniphilus]
MAYDGIFTYCMINELKQLKNGKITKIYQPFKHEVILHIRSNGKNQKLLLSAHPSYSRVHLTNETLGNPEVPPMFCMVLRKHLEGSVIEEIEGHECERMIFITVRSRNEIGDITYKRLIIEIMGRHSNIILMDIDKNIIIDAIKHLSPAQNRYRTVLPGQPYVLPPKQDKLDAFHISEEDVLRKLDFNSGKLADQIVQKIGGISPLLAKEMVFKAGIANRATLPKEVCSLLEKIKDRQMNPTIMINKEKELFYLFPLDHIKSETKSFDSLSEMLDRFYFQKAERDRVKQQTHDIERFLLNERKKNKTKLKKLANTLDSAKQADQYRLFGELLTSHIYAFKKGDKKVTVSNYYEEDNSSLTIEINPLKSPSENAQFYFQKYQKAKKSISIVKEQIEQTNIEIEYIEGLLQQLESASVKDVKEIREELIEGGYFKKKQSKQSKKRKQQAPVLEKYLTSNQEVILVGKNNKQNEYLTNKFASKRDLWFHTKDIPGSHVVLKSENPSEESIMEAAQLAAYFSKAKNSSNVPVDYTLIKNVKKPNGAKPGYVIYDDQLTIYATPDEDKILSLKK